MNGTSNTGKATLRELAHYTEFYTVKATSRSAPSAALSAELPHVHWLVSDLSKDSLLAVTKGVEKVFYAAPAVENRVEIARNLAAALAANSVQYVVHISVAGCHYRSILFANQFKDQEEAFEASGVPYTHVRCPGFLDNFFGVSQSVKSQSTVYWTDLSHGMAFVAVSDIGKACARLLTRSGAEGVTVEFTGKSHGACLLVIGSESSLFVCTGPELVTTEVVKSAFSEVLGRPIGFVTVPVEGYVASMAGLEPWFSKGLGELATLIAEGHGKVKKSLLTSKKWCS